MPIEMTPDRWEATQAYLEETFAHEPRALAALRRDAVEAGFPSISVGPAAGRLLSLLAGMLRDGAGAERIIEVGMLAGYSALCLAQGLSPTGRLITIEPDRDRITFAEKRFSELGESRIEVREGLGIPVLDSLYGELGEESVDLVFLDAIKIEYLDYFARARTLLRPGGVLIADNVLGTGDYWITQEPGLSENRDAIARFNQAVAVDAAFESMPIPIRQGLLVARKRRS
mgnify:CR=1 FL=1